eukprot:CAMPEP_0197648432 /NCGR_PEP_ID=MMETSP1338-20131121/27751_1 /TAXON_ID=43686 ORGANISM="Pelagodinium beii, Strain RCC1491" /NCGR_SAMPLE_ID=MMETSP1338 /ASSEMBLY_ACC=CAM_ASM_000754 /LENGTH=84 /DNA_ID=CAMNT_0043222423 /DNA_START=52 /DNA_END=303 /DNA_ORIENTATION=+
MARTLAIFALLQALVASADDLHAALKSDDSCLAKGEDCGLELLQVKGQARAVQEDGEQDAKSTCINEGETGCRYDQDCCGRGLT